MSYHSHPQTDSEITISLLHQNTPVSFHAGGRSMHPVIRDGETVLIRPLCNNAIRPYAILLANCEGKLILHRFIGRDRKSGHLLLLGDAFTAANRIHPNDIIGVAVSVHRNGRRIALDTPASRAHGWLRYAQQRLRCNIRKHTQRNHTPTSPR